MKKTITIRFATEADKEKVGDFRKEQYKTAKEFKVLDESVLYKQRGKVFVAELDGEIISTMQIEEISDAETLHNISATVIPSWFNHFPTLYLSKGATKTEYRNTGINSYLRLITLQLALSTNIQSLVGTAYEGSSRINLLKRIGYTTTTTTIEKEYQNFNTPLFLCLERSKFVNAIELLKKETEYLVNEYTIVNVTKLKGE